MIDACEGYAKCAILKGSSSSFSEPCARSAAYHDHPRTMTAKQRERVRDWMNQMVSPVVCRLVEGEEEGGGLEEKKRKGEERRESRAGPASDCGKSPATAATSAQRSSPPSQPGLPLSHHHHLAPSKDRLIFLAHHAPLSRRFPPLRCPRAR